MVVLQDFRKGLTCGEIGRFLVLLLVPEYSREYLRERYVKPFRVLYAVRGDVCTVVGVIHASRYLLAAFHRDDIDSLPGGTDGS
jgi:hypothetical protein